MLPDERGGLIETMRTIAIEIVNQNFVRQFLNHETVFASEGLSLTIFVLHVCLRRNRRKGSVLLLNLNKLENGKVPRQAQGVNGFQVTCGNYIKLTSGKLNRNVL